MLICRCTNTDILSFDLVRLPAMYRRSAPLSPDDHLSIGHLKKQESAMEIS